MGYPPGSSAAPAPPPSSSLVPTYAVGPVSPVRTSSASGKRLTAATLILVAAILLAVSMGLSWWGATITGNGESISLYFNPGSSYSGSGNTGAGFFSGSATYASAGLGHVGQLYNALFGVGLLAAIAGFAAMGLAFVGALGGFRSRTFLRVTLVLLAVTFVAAAFLPAVVAVSQPAAFSADGAAGFPGTGSGCGAGENPCNSFWGSVSANGTTASWGADVGWYLGLAAATILFVALIMLLSTRRQPYTRDELWAAYSPTIVPGAYPGGQVPPTFPQNLPPWPTPIYPQSAPWCTLPTTPSTYPAPDTTSVVPPATSATPSCPRCGSPVWYVAQYSRYYCTRCGAYL